MLSFFRKNQKTFLIVVATLVIVSFVFFGTQSTLRQGDTQVIQDKVLGKMVGGVNLRSAQLTMMKRFLVTDRWDYGLQERGERVNFFNDGVIRNDLLESGLAQILVEGYFDAVYSDLEKRFENEKTFTPYSHPGSKHLSVEMMWNQFVPAMAANLEKVKVAEVGPELFALKTKLYLEQSKFPPHMLKRFLLYQQSQSPHIKPDPSLQGRDLGLFGYKGIEDWFGKRFVELCAQFVMNSAVIAKEMGYSVSKQEAKADLMRNGYEALQESGHHEISSEMLTKLWNEQLMSLGLTEKQAVDKWRKVMLFRRVFEAQGSKTIVDRLLYEKYHAYSSEKLKLDVYEIPMAKRVGSLRDLFELFYFEDQGKNLKVREFEVDVAHVNESDVAMNVGLKEMWSWQVSDEGWKRLKKKFKQLNGDDRQAALEKVEEKDRKEIDKFSREAIVVDNPHWREDMLVKAEGEKRVLKLPLTGKCELEGISDVKALIGKLETDDLVSGYSQDGKTIYRIEVLDRDETARVMDYDEAKKLGALKAALKVELEKSYKANKSQYVKNDGSPKPFADVEMEVGRQYFKKQLMAIESTFAKKGGKLKKGSLKEDDDFYTANAFVEMAEEHLERLKNGESLEDSAMQKRYVEVMRKERSIWNDEILFTKDPGYISDVKMFGKDGSVGFCQIVDRCQGDDNELAQHMKEGQALIGSEAKKAMMQKIVDRIKKEDGIHLEAQ